MTKAYTPVTFLRQTPNLILKEYFHSRGLLKNIDFDTLKKTETDPIMASWLDLENKDYSEIEFDFRRINQLCTIKGIILLYELLRSYKKITGDEDPFEGMENPYEKAFWVFNNHLELLKIANDYDYMDSVHSWTRYGLEPGKKPLTTKQATNKLMGALSEHFKKMGCGRRYRATPPYTRQNPERYCYITYVEGHANTVEVLDDHNQIQLTAVRPAFEIIFVYYPDTGLFETNAKGKKDDVRAIQTIFGETILELKKLPPDNKMRLKLNGLLDEDVELPTKREKDDIAGAYLKSIRIGLNDDDRTKMTLDISPKEGRRPIQELIQQLRETEEERAKKDKEATSLKKAEVLKATIKFDLVKNNRYNKRSFQFDLTAPDGTGLGNDRIDFVAKKYIKEWGLTDEDTPSEIG
ncbi:MAG: hypothetical protein DRP56_01410 [Planctomycetota bacterium]|nr:MAG: hypothetical protein DRP56_01410 [Planctomycetota bacterium]